MMVGSEHCLQSEFFIEPLKYLECDQMVMKFNGNVSWLLSAAMKDSVYPDADAQLNRFR